MNKRLGAIAVVACVCGLLFSGAASARQTANKITVTGAVLGPAPSGTYVQFWTGNSAPYGDGTPFKLISFSGGSNFHFSWIGSSGGSGCDLTPSNGGVSCAFAQPLPNFWINTIISGTLPAAVTGTVIYEDNSTGTFTAPVTNGSPATYGYSMGAVVKGSTIQISVGSALLALPPILQFSLSGRSNWHVTAISSTAGGSCGLTPTNGGGSCAFATPVTSFVLSVTFSGPPPTYLSGQITYAHGTTIPWAYEFSCHCTKASTEVTGFKKENHGEKLVLFLKWKVGCSVGSRDICRGVINIDHPALPPGLQLRRADGKAWHGGKVTILCNPKTGARCAPAITGERKLDLVGPAAARAREAVTFHVRLRCGGGGLGGTHTKEDLTLRFDRHGNLDRKKSHLGQLG